jgi:hypothetical protein
MQYADRIQETTTTAGTGAVSMGGAASGYRAFSSAFVTGTQVSYCLVDGTAWEVGYGTLTTGSPWTMSRDLLIASSTGSAINLSGGSTTVFNTASAGQVDWPTVGTTIAAADTVTVPAGRQMNMTTNLGVLGALNLLGDLAVL